MTTVTETLAGGTVREAIGFGCDYLAGRGIEDCPREVRRMLEFALGLGRGRLVLHMDDVPDADARTVFLECLRRRARREPLSHILGVREFWTRRFTVTASVLDPRPETECLVALALEKTFSEVLDLGTGSGCILLTLLAERPDARGTGTDICPAALDVARANAEALGVAGRCRLVASDWFGAVPGRFDLIVSNPPYIAAAEMPALAPELAHEPRAALTDGGDGLGACRAIGAGAGAHLKPGGQLLVEIGRTQGAAVAGIFRAAGLAEVRVHPDIDGRDRVVSARRPESAVARGQK